MNTTKIEAQLSFIAEKLSSLVDAVQNLNDLKVYVEVPDKSVEDSKQNTKKRASKKSNTNSDEFAKDN